MALASRHSLMKYFVHCGAVQLLCTVKYLRLKVKVARCKKLLCIIQVFQWDRFLHCLQTKGQQDKLKTQPQKRPRQAFDISPQDRLGQDFDSQSHSQISWDNHGQKDKSEIILPCLGNLSIIQIIQQNLNILCLPFKEQFSVFESLIARKSALK